MIGIVIPTLNRSKFLARALAFYDIHKFDGIIYVLDSSNPTEKAQNENLIEQYSESLLLNYYHILGPHDGACITQFNSSIHEKVKYLCFSGDDDFQVPKGLKVCAEFLDNNLDYVSAHGQRINFAYTQNKVRLMNVRHGYNWDETFTQSERLQEYLRVGIAMSNYLHRKDHWIERYKVCDQIPTRYLGGELCAECTTALSGKVKFITDVVSFLFYQDNPERVFSFNNTTLFDLVNSVHWHQSYSTTLDWLTSLMEVPDKSVMNRELYYHIISIMTSQYTARYGMPQEVKLSKTDSDLGMLSQEIGELLNTVGKIAYGHN
jgi:glycosyltransferase domain-containing protein